MVASDAIIWPRLQFVDGARESSAWRRGGACACGPHRWGVSGKAMVVVAHIWNVCLQAGCCFRDVLFWTLVQLTWRLRVQLIPT